MTGKTNIKHIKTTDTALINEICDLGDITIDARTRWSIEFDDYGIQGVVDAIRKNFVEQAIDAIFDMRHRLNRKLDASEIADMLKELK